MMKNLAVSTTLIATAGAFVVDPTPPAAAVNVNANLNTAPQKKVASLMQHMVDATRLENPSVSGVGGALSLGLYSGTTADPLLNSSPELPKNEWVEPNTDPEVPALPVPEEEEPAPASTSRGWNPFKNSSSSNKDTVTETGTETVTETDKGEVAVEVQAKAVEPEVEVEEVVVVEAEAKDTVEAEEQDPLPAPSMNKLSRHFKSIITDKKLPEEATAALEDEDADDEAKDSLTAGIPSLDELKEQFQTFCNEPFTPGQFVLQYLPPDTELTNGAFIIRSFILFLLGAYLTTGQYRLSKMSKQDDQSEAERMQKMEAEQMDSYEKEEAEARRMASIFSKNDSYEEEGDDNEEDALEDVLTVMEEIDEDVLSKTNMGGDVAPDSTKDPKLYPIDEDDEQDDEESEGGTVSISDDDTTLQQPPSIQRADVQPFPTIDESSVPSREASSNDSVGSGSLTTNCPNGKDADPNPAEEHVTPGGKKQKRSTFRFPKMKSPARKAKSPRRWRQNKQKDA